MKLSLSVFLLAISISLFAQEGSPTKNQLPKTLSLNPNDLGALENSVNLFTGQVTFPMNLASTPGRGGLSASVSIQYNSNVNSTIDTWNVESPTSVVGLGWSLEIPRIVVNNKLTGTRSDDEFYLIEGSQSKKLVCLNSTNYPRRYEVKSPDPWRVEYYHIEEKWIITKENGFKYTYGGQNSNRGTIQWIVRWGNWIGSSTMSTGQQQQAYIWNISEIENLWGNKILFEYENVEEFVAHDLSAITTHKKHTKASYLKRVTDPVGYSIEFLYGEKIYENTAAGKKEYQDPHIEKAEPDAYQEKYETRYLDRLIVGNYDGSLLYETDLEYSTELIGVGDVVKRTLISIKNIYPSGKSMPPIKFEYFTSGAFIGSLKKVTNAYGAFYDYSYARSKIPFSSLDISVDAPINGLWQEHYVYQGNDYVIVVWRTVNSDGSHNAGFRPSKIWLYYWDGQWNKKDLTEGTQNGYINLKTRENDEKERVLDWQIVLGEYFFSYLYQNDIYTNQHDAKIWYRNEPTGKDWNLQSTMTSYQSPILLNGDHFVAISGLLDRIIHTYVFNGDGSDGIGYGMNFLDIDASDEEAEYYVSAADNYIFVHNDNGGRQDYVHVFHLTEEKKWKKSSASPDNIFNTDGEGFKLSYWHSFNSFTMGLPWDNEEFIYMWDENYNNIKRINGWGSWPDDSYVISRNNSSLSAIEKTDNPFNIYADIKTARYDGNSWRFNDISTSGSDRNVSIGSDFTIHDRWAMLSPREAIFQVYDPNLSAWRPPVTFYHNSTYLKEGENGGLAIEAGQDAFVIGDGDYYTRDFQGNWSYTSKLKLGTNEYLVGRSLLLTPSLIGYEYGIGKTGNSTGSYLGLLKNGKLNKFLRFPGKTFNSKPSYHIGNSIVAHVDSKTKLVLRKVIDFEAAGPLYANHVTILRWYDGNKVFHNAYDYDLTAAKLDRRGNLAYFNKVGVIQGSSNSAQRPFGHTDYYFYNGITPAKLIAKPLSLHSQAYTIGIGEIYQTSVIDAGKDTVGFSKVKFDIFNKTIKNSDDQKVDGDFYLRPTIVQQMADSVFVETTNNYHDDGLLDFAVSENSRRNEYSSANHSWVKTTEQRIRHFTYWWEIYDPQRTSPQWLNEVVQITDTYGSSHLTDTLSSVVTRWKTWENGKKAPDIIYGWLGKNTISFPAWSYPSNPSPNEWKPITEIKRRDLQTGAVLESQGISGITEAIIYDETQTRVLASAANANYNAIAFTSFEEKSSGNWIYNESATVKSDTCLTGERYFQSITSDISSQSLVQGLYTLSFWAKHGTPQVNVTNGNIVSTKIYPQKTGWILYKTTVQITATTGIVKLAGNGAMIDELRLHPSNAKMTSYTYNPFGSTTSETSPEHLVAYYAYDDMNRPFLVKDHAKNIIKRYNYRYRDEEEHLSALIQYPDTVEAGSPIQFAAIHPIYHSVTAIYEWNFGDGTTRTTEESTTNHTYGNSGHYQVKVNVIYTDTVIATDVKSIRIPETLTVSARISSGSNQLISCPQNPNTQAIDFSVTVISSNCQGYTYTWFYQTDGSIPVQFGSGTSTSYVFSSIDQYQVYCKVSNSCGQSVDSSSITITVEGTEEYCSIGNQH